MSEHPVYAVLQDWADSLTDELEAAGVEDIAAFAAVTASDADMNVHALKLKASSLLFSIDLREKLRAGSLSAEDAAFLSAGVFQLSSMGQLNAFLPNIISGARMRDGSRKGAKVTNSRKPHITPEQAAAVVQHVRNTSHGLKETEIKLRASKELGISKSTLYSLLKK